MGAHLHFEYRDEPDRLRYIVTPQEAADAWAAGVAGAQTKYTQGVQNTTKDVAGLAVAAQSALLANFTQAVTSGLWARRLAERGTAYWKQQTVAKASNYATGAQAGKGNFLAAAQQLLPYIAQGETQIANMPSGTLADSIARVTFWLQYMAAFKQQFVK